MFETYKFHKQEHDCPIKEKIVRIVAPKVIAVVNSLIRIFSTTEKHQDFKKFTRNSLLINEKIALLKKVDIPSLKPHFLELLKEKDFFKNGSRVLKFIAFHLGQAITLIGKKKQKK